MLTCLYNSSNVLQFMEKQILKLIIKIDWFLNKTYNKDLANKLYNKYSLKIMHDVYGFELFFEKVE